MSQRCLGRAANARACLRSRPRVPLGSLRHASRPSPSPGPRTWRVGTRETPRGSWRSSPPTPATGARPLARPPGSRAHPRCDAARIPWAGPDCHVPGLELRQRLPRPHGFHEVLERHRIVAVVLPRHRHPILTPFGQYERLRRHAAGQRRPTRPYDLRSLANEVDLRQVEQILHPAGRSLRQLEAVEVEHQSG
jgi:hypothetical protein